MRLWPGSILALLLAVPTLPAASQGWVTRSPYRYSPLASHVKRLQWDRIFERSRYKRILKKRGYTQARLNGMTTSQLSAAALGDAAVPASTAKPAARMRSRAAPTKFKPVKKRLYLATLARSLTKDKAQQKALRKIFETGIRAYEAQAKKELKYDVAAAMVFLLGAGLTVYNQGQEPSDTGLEQVARGLQASLDTDAMRRVSRKDKQKFYELMLGYGTYLMASYQVATREGDTKFAGELREMAKAAIEGFLKLDASKVQITETGMEPSKGEANEPRTAPASELP